jgi:hypothetical protein
MVRDVRPPRAETIGEVRWKGRAVQETQKNATTSRISERRTDPLQGIHRHGDITHPESIQQNLNSGQAEL